VSRSVATRFGPPVSHSLSREPPQVRTIRASLPQPPHSDMDRCRHPCCRAVPARSTRLTHRPADPQASGTSARPGTPIPALGLSHRLSLRAWALPPTSPSARAGPRCRGGRHRCTRQAVRDGLFSAPINVAYRAEGQPSRAGLPDSSPLRRRKFELATVRGTAYAGPKLGRRDVRQTTVRTAVVVVVAPRLEGGFQILKTEEPM